jgi:hypothetical protein
VCVWEGWGGGGGGGGGGGDESYLETVSVMSNVHDCQFIFSCYYGYSIRN